MTTYGVTPTGFSRKPLATILAEIEAANIDTFGAGIIQTAQSPLGQLNGIFANFSAELWEMMEGVYQSLNPDEAEGINLDRIGRLRGVVRNGLSDAAYRAAITNKGGADIHIAPAINDIRALDGVTFVRVFENATAIQDPETFINSHSVAFAVIGGDDGLVAEAIFNNTVAGIGLHGSTLQPINDGGFCRIIKFTRPSIIEVNIYVTVSVLSSGGCEPPTVDEVKEAIYTKLNYTQEDCSLVNGDELTADDIRRAVTSLPGARMVDVAFGFSEDNFATELEYIDVPFEKIVHVDKGRINVSYA